MCQSFCSYHVGFTFSFWKTLRNSGVSQNPAPGARGGPQRRVVDRELPARGPAHREAAGDEPVLVDAVVLLDVVEALERVDLAGELVGVAVAAVGVQDERVRRRELMPGRVCGGWP